MRLKLGGIGAVLVLGLGLSACEEKPRGVEAEVSVPAVPQLVLVRSTPACQVRDGKLAVTVRNDGRTTNSPVNTWVEAKFPNGSQRAALPTVYPNSTEVSLIEFPAGCPGANCRVTLRIVEGVQQSSERVYDELSATCVG